MSRVVVGIETVRQCPSDSYPDVIYYQQLGSDGIWRCSCPGYFHREECKHVKRLAAETERNKLIAELQQLVERANEIKSRLKELQ